jgi:sugar phosphate isomerase/epimerase
MTLTRRSFLQTGAGSAAALALAHGTPLLAQGAAALAQPQRPNSLIHGVQIGLQPFCYHDLPNTPQNRPTLIQRMVQNGINVVELHAVWYEPRFTGPGVDAAEARRQQRAWRLATPASFYEGVKREFAAAGISIFSIWINIDPSFTDDEIDAVFAGAKALGAREVDGSYGLAMAARLAPFPAKHGMVLGLHNHDNISDADAFSTETTFIHGLSLSPDFRATLDVRHFTAADGDSLAFLEKHHDRMVSLHLGDRRRSNGRSTPFGEGDAPIIEILRMIRDNGWPIIAFLEFEHGTTRNGVEEVAVVMDYCRRALA